MKFAFDPAYSDREDKDLISKALTGSKSALDQLLRRHYQFIYNVALRFVLSPYDAEDLTQEVMIKVITKLSQFNHEANFRTWLYRIVFNHFLNSKRRKTEQDMVSFDTMAHGLDSIPLETLTAEEERLLKDQIEDAKIGCMTGMILCLSREQRLVFILGELFEINSKIGSELLGITPDNYRKILSRARKDLYQFMNNKCGLVNTSNPCRCPGKTRGFIKNGWVNPGDLQFNNHFKNRISSLSLERANAYEQAFEEKYSLLFKEHPYYDKDKSQKILQDIVDDPQLREIFDL